MHLFPFKQYLQYYPEAKVGGRRGEKCKNHKKLHQFCSKISVHLKTDYHITTHYPREKKTTKKNKNQGPSPVVHNGSTMEKGKEIQWLNTIQEILQLTDG